MINDAFSFSDATDKTKPFKILKYLKQETDDLPWFTAIHCLERFTSLLHSTSAFGNYEKFIIDLITPLYNKLGWVEGNNDDYRIR